MFTFDSSILPILLVIFGSGGFWACVQSYISTHNRKRENEDAEMSLQTRMLKGLGHDRIIYLCGKYIERGYITKEEFENLSEYLFEPYVALGGNGTAKKLMDDVKKLPVHEHHEGVTS